MWKVQGIFLYMYWLLHNIKARIYIVDIDYRPLGNLEGALVANEYKTEGVILINNSKEAGTKERQRFWYFNIWVLL
jgi:hypothetical protein